jgi:thermitase
MFCNNKQMLKQTIITILVLYLGLSIYIPADAQEETPPVEPQPTEEIISPDPVETESPTATEPTPEILTPTVEPTSEATAEPTANITIEPTDEATPEATAEITTEPTAEATLEPTLVVDTPSFTIDQNTFDAVPGIPLTFQVIVSDNFGAVEVSYDTTNTQGGLSINANPSTETSAPYLTVVDVTYLPPANYVGTDAFTLTATNINGGAAAVTIQVNVGAAEVTPEVTEEPARLNELIINYDPNASEESIQAILQALNAIEVERIPQIGALRVLVPAAVSEPTDALQTLQADALAASAEVEAVEEIVYYYAQFLPNDPLFDNDQSSDTKYQWGIQDVLYSTYVPTAWDFAPKRGAGIVVAVLDHGIDNDHPDLDGILVPGWNFMYDSPNTDNGSASQDDHGSHVAGIIAAETNNGIGIAGIAHNAKIMPVTVCDGSIGCPSYEIAAGMVFAADNGAKVINMSLGGLSPSTTIQSAVNYALSRNVVIVAAAGNNGNSNNLPFYPASYPGVISVGASQKNGTIATFSNHHNVAGLNPVTVAAPGVSIVSTVPLQPPTLDTDTSNPPGYEQKPGTSMAAPHVSGIVALLLAEGVAKNPDQVREALICSADPPVLPRGQQDEYFGYGIVQADLALSWRADTNNCRPPLPNDNIESATALVIGRPIEQVIHSRSATRETSDPDDCFTSPNQTIWFKFKGAAGIYSFTTLGSESPNYIGLYRGTPTTGLTSIGCDNDADVSDADGDPPDEYATAFVTAQLNANEQYYLAVSTGDSNGLNDELVRVQVLPAITVNGGRGQEENATNLAFIDAPDSAPTATDWSLVTLAGASGNRVRRSNVPGAMIAFAFRGTNFDLYRTTGAGYGTVDVYVNDVLVRDDLSNTGDGTLRPAQAVNIVAGTNPGQMNRVRIVLNGPNALFDFDKVVTFDAPTATGVRAIAAKTDVATTLATNFTFTGNWTTTTGLPTTAYFRGTTTSTSTAGNKLTFRTRGSAVTLYRTTGPTMGTMYVRIDGAFYSISNQDAAGGGTGVPYTIGNLANTEHVIDITHVSGDMLEIDAVAGGNNVAHVGAVAGKRVDDADRNLLYSGSWLRATDVTAFRGTLNSWDGTGDAKIEFAFVGNEFCLHFDDQVIGGGDIEVYIDRNDYIGTIDTSANLGGRWCSSIAETTGAYPTALLPDTRHDVRLYISNGPVNFDGVTVYKRRVLVAGKLYAENDPSLAYLGTWRPLMGTAAISAGGYKPQGGRVNYSYTHQGSVEFYINGTGFILYTATGRELGAYRVLVDGEPVEITDIYYDSNPDPNITTVTPYYPDAAFPNTLYLIGDVFCDLTQSPNCFRYRPMAYGVNDLGPGIHKVQLISVTDVTYLNSIDFVAGSEVSRRYQQYGLPLEISPGVLSYSVIMDGVRVIP